MRARGYVLAGGLSRRMGRDKALLPWRGSTLICHVAGVVSQVASPVVIVGPPERYDGFGFPVIADLRPGLGPLAGLETALHHSDTDWNLVVACDLPDLTPDALARLLARAAEGDAAAVVAGSPAEPQPLCAAYHRRVLPAAAALLDANKLKIKDMLSLVPTAFLPEIALTANLNTPADWLAAGGAHA